jgi:hypothetical protein
MEEEVDEGSKLIELLCVWGKRNGFKFIAPVKDRDVDFININLKTRTIYVDCLNVDENLTIIG